MAASSASSSKAEPAAAPKEKKGKKLKRKRGEDASVPEKADAPEEVAVPEEAAVPSKAKAEPAKSPKKKTKAHRLEEMQAAADDEPYVPRGVIYVGHVPDGFYEPQMKKFFGQFGKVTRLRISRSKKNAASKGFGFVEFEDEGVAEIVAQTMHKYLLFGKQLVCHLVPKEKQHRALFKGCRSKMVNFTNKRRKNFRATYNDRPTAEVDGEQVARMTLRQASKQRRASRKLKDLLANAGVEYNVDEVVGTPAISRGNKAVSKTEASADAAKQATEPAAASAPTKDAPVAAVEATPVKPAADRPAKKKRRKAA